MNITIPFYSRTFFGHDEKGKTATAYNIFFQKEKQNQPDRLSPLK